MPFTLYTQGNLMADTGNQLRIINEDSKIPTFDDSLEPVGLHPLTATGIEVLQINLGKMCNQTCKHCHVDAGPDRKEIMTRKSLEKCLKILETTEIPTVDLTGGAPEMNPNFKWFVSEAHKLNRHMMVRSNLTILVSKLFADYPDFFKTHKVEVISSLPYYLKENTDAQRGAGVFEKSITALKKLNDIGYGREGTGLMLNLVFNPVGAFLPPDQTAIQSDYKRELKKPLWD